MVGVNVEGLNGGVKMQGIPGVTEYYNTACIGGACLTFGKTFKESIKRLCEDYGRYGHEDAHMTFEMRSLGKLVVCLSDFGIHLGDNSFHKKVDSWGEEYVQWKLDRFNESKSKLLKLISLIIVVLRLLVLFKSTSTSFKFFGSKHQT